MRDPATVVERVVERLRPLQLRSSQAWWDANVDASEANEARRVEAELELTSLLGDEGLFADIVAAREAADGGVVRRQLDLLHDAFLTHQVPEELRTRIVELEASVESRFVRHRGVVGGTPVGDNEIRRILRTSRDEDERREAWEASKGVGAAVADDVRRLARLRNESARGLGYRDWFALSTATAEMDEGRLLGTLAACDEATRAPFERWKAALDARLAERYGRSPDELRPWHYEDPFFQEVPTEGGIDLDPIFAGGDLPALARRTFDGIGLETAPILERSDLLPREGKCQHAFCIDIDRAGDIRVLANLEPSAYWMETMLHELGHGVYDDGFDRSLPWLLQSTHLVPTEGIAILFGRLHRDRAWLETVAGVERGEAEALAPQLAEAAAVDLLVFTRWVLVMTNFERALYADPDGDLDTTWWELVRRYQRVEPAPGRRAPDWAAKIHVALAPVYYHNYLYGQLVASQLRATLEREAGGLVDAPAAGSLLRERIFAPGESLRWDRLLERATGAPLGIDAFAAEIAAGVGA